MSRCFVVIIDGLGIGAQEDAADYGDAGTNTIGHVLKQTGAELPNFEQLGLGNIESLATVRPTETPKASFGKMREVSAGKDSTTGHWELAGVQLDTPFPTYPNGFPDEVIESFCRIAGVNAVLSNEPYSGTEVIRDYGREHLSTGRPIVYTSADSVFQVACHVDVTPVEELYEWCERARKEVLTGDHAVGRVIARPFHGAPGSFGRLTDQRKDFSLAAPEPNLMTVLQNHGIKTYSIGKIIDLFGGVGFTQYRKTKSNAEGLSQLLSLMSANISDSFVFVNLIDTDQVYGHRQNPEGYAEAMQEIDRALPPILGKLNPGDLLIITGDHGNDPTDDSTDHTREFVPLLAMDPEYSVGVNLGTRASFADMSATVIEFFEADNSLRGESFLKIIRGEQ